MKPYVTGRSWVGIGALAVVFLFTFALPLDAHAAGKKKSQPTAHVVRNTPDALTRSGFDHFYNQEYDAATRDFQKVVDSRPDDPMAVNHLMGAIMFKELYRIGALDTELYANDSFLDAKQFPSDPKVRAQIKELADRGAALCEKGVQENSNNVEALYARGVNRGLRATYMGMMQKSWVGALRAAIGARRDHERVLELDPAFTDAKFNVGVHNYIVGSINWAWKVAAAVVGLSGSKQKGLQYLWDAANGGGETVVDAKLALAMFLRREQKYPEAIKLVDELTHRYPKNFLLALEYANLLNAAGHGPDAIAAYHRVITGANAGIYWQPRMEQAHYGLAEALRGQRHYAEAAEAYESVSADKKVDPDLRERATLSAGQVYDMMQKRDLAMRKYQDVISANTTSVRTGVAKKYLKSPYKGEKG